MQLYNIGNFSHHLIKVNPKSDLLKHSPAPNVAKNAYQQIWGRMVGPQSFTEK